MSGPKWTVSHSNQKWSAYGPACKSPWFQTGQPRWRGGTVQHKQSKIAALSIRSGDSPASGRGKFGRIKALMVKPPEKASSINFVGSTSHFPRFSRSNTDGSVREQRTRSNTWMRARIAS